MPRFGPLRVKFGRLFRNRRISSIKKRFDLIGALNRPFVIPNVNNGDALPRPNTRLMKSKVDTMKSANSPEAKNQSPLETLQRLGVDTSPEDGVQSGNKTFGVSEERLADLFENAPIGIYLSTERRLLRANRELTRMFGYASEAEAVASVSDASEFFVDPAQRRRIVERAKNSPSYIEEEVLYRRKNGSAFIANLRMRAVCDASGAVTVLEGFVEDITERKRLEQEIRQAQKMEVIGQFTGGVAHDFNNILAATLMHLGLLLRGPEMSSGVRNTLREIEDEIMRAANLTRQLLLFSRRQRVQFRPVHINALINDFLKMLRRVLGENIELNFEQGASLPMVKVDSGMIEQVIMNLCVNARDAMPKGGKLKLTTGLKDRTCDDASVQPEARAGRFVCLSVGDTGCGMNQEVLKHLFEPFFTTKEVGKGTGLGLATVFGIVKQHAGWVDVESVIGKGSCFQSICRSCLRLPIIPPAKVIQNTLAEVQKPSCWWKTRSRYAACRPSVCANSAMECW